MEVRSVWSQGPNVLNADLNGISFVSFIVGGQIEVGIRIDNHRILTRQTEAILLSPMDEAKWACKR